MAMTKTRPFLGGRHEKRPFIRENKASLQIYHCMWLVKNFPLGGTVTEGDYEGINAAHPLIHRKRAPFPRRGKAKRKTNERFSPRG